MAGLRTRPHFLRLLATLSSRNGLSHGVTGHTAAGTAPASHRIPFSRHLSHHDLLQSYEFFIQSFIIYMKGDQAALLDDLVRYGAQFFFPFLRGPLLTKAAQRFALSFSFYTTSAHEQARLDAV